MEELKGNRMLACPCCGKMHMVEGDYFLPGISGTIVNTKGVPVVFVDPTEPPKCDECVEDMLKKLMSSTNNDI